MNNEKELYLLYVLINPEIENLSITIIYLAEKNLKYIVPKGLHFSFYQAQNDVFECLEHSIF